MAEQERRNTEQKLNEYTSYAEQCAITLQRDYDWSTGLWKTANWWNNANALEATIDFDRITKQQRYTSIITNTFEKNKDNSFFNNFHDDEGWWCLAMIKAHDATQKSEYLNMARVIFSNMSRGWDETVFNGGMWWNDDMKYKNAITNELFLTAAARLHTRTQLPEYRRMASKTWNWFYNSGLINADNLINDGLDDQGKNNGQNTWTYNQAVILGGLSEMYDITKGDVYLDIGSDIALAAIAKLVNHNGIFVEDCENDPNGCGNDGPQFKGIFARYLGDFTKKLFDARGNTLHVKAFKSALERNANSVWANDRTPDNQFGLRWTGPTHPHELSAVTQTSALDVFNAATTVSTLTGRRKKPSAPRLVQPPNP